MSYTGDETSVDIELVEIFKDGTPSHCISVEGVDKTTYDFVDVIDLLRLAGVDRRAWREGQRFHIKISYSYPS